MLKYTVKRLLFAVPLLLGIVTATFFVVRLAPGDPMEHTRRLLGLDGVRAGNGRTRLKAINGEAFVIEDGN